MQITLAVFALVVLSAFTEAKPTTDEPPFCNKLECPHFNTINKTDKYETRSYPTAYKWASTVVAGRKFALFLFELLLFPLISNYMYTKRSGSFVITCHATPTGVHLTRVTTVENCALRRKRDFVQSLSNPSHSTPPSLLGNRLEAEKVLNAFQPSLSSFCQVMNMTKQLEWVLCACSST